MDQERPNNLRQYLTVVLVIAAVTGVNVLVAPSVDNETVSLIYLLAVTMLALVTGLGPGFMAATLSTLLWNFLFVSPRFTLGTGKFEDILMFVMYFVVALITGSQNA